MPIANKACECVTSKIYCPLYDGIAEINFANIQGYKNLNNLGISLPGFELLYLKRNFGRILKFVPYNSGFIAALTVENPFWKQRVVYHQPQIIISQAEIYEFGEIVRRGWMVESK